MRWNHKVYSWGDHRIVKRFALLPIQCDKGHYHWLEYMEVDQIYYLGCWSDFGSHICNVNNEDTK